MSTRITSLKDVDNGDILLPRTRTEAVIHGSEVLNDIIDDIEEVIPSEASSSNKLADKAYVDTGLNNRVSPIEAKIPSTATSSNKLTDKAYVDSLYDEFLKTQYTLVDGTSPVYADNVPTGAQEYAEIGMLGGKTIVWNQLVQNGNFESTSGWDTNNATQTASNNTLTINVTSSNGYGMYREIPVFAGHKFYYSLEFKGDNGASYTFNGNLSPIVANGTWQYLSKIRTEDTAFNYVLARGEQVSTMQIKNFIMVDLTQMFGQGSEPTTVAQFKAMFPLDYYEYNTGTLLSGKVDKVVGTGFNSWDEEWELGGLDSATGQESTSTECIRAKNYIAIVPNSTYYAKCPTTANVGLRIAFYDANKNFIEYSGDGAYGKLLQLANTTFTPVANAKYIRFYTRPAYGTTYNNDICINVSQTDTTKSPHNGDYKPYHYAETAIPSAIQQLDGYGKSAGSVYNYVDLAPTLYKNMKSVDLGSLTYERKYNSTTGWYWFEALLSIKPISVGSKPNMLSSIYSSIERSSDISYTLVNDRTICGTISGDKIVLRNDTYTDAQAFKQAMSGVILHYEATSGGSDYEAYLYHKKIGEVDLGSLNDWYYENNNQYFKTDSLSTLVKKPSSNDTQANLLCAKYINGTWNTSAPIGTGVNLNMGINSSNGSLSIRDIAYTDAQAFKTAMNGVMLQYELANEQILDITDLVAGNNIIDIENGGTVTLHQQNDTRLQIPNNIYYLQNLYDHQ